MLDSTSCRDQQEAMETLAARQSSRFSEDAEVTCQSLLKEISMSIGTLLLILLLIGAIPAWPHSRSWGYGAIRRTRLDAADRSHPAAAGTPVGMAFQAPLTPDKGAPTGHSFGELLHLIMPGDSVAAYSASASFTPRSRAVGVQACSMPNSRFDRWILLSRQSGGRSPNQPDDLLEFNMSKRPRRIRPRTPLICHRTAHVIDPSVSKHRYPMPCHDKQTSLIGAKESQ